VTVPRDHIRSRLLSPLYLWSVCALLTSCHSDVPPGSPEAVSGRLVELVQDQSADMRRTAVEALGKIGLPSHVSTLTRMLNDPDPHVREASAIAVGRLQDSPVDQCRFIEALADSSDAVRSAVARTLGEVGDPQTLGPRLARSLREGDLPARRAAVQALIELDVPLAYSALRKALHDIDSEVRQGAVAALGEADAAAQVVPLLMDRLLHDETPGVRGEAAFRLGKIGDETTVRELERIARADHDPIVRRWAQWAAVQLRPQRGSG
jgi:HEAT repeat protein